MKKIIAFIALFALCLSLFVGCTTEKTDPLEAAKDYLFTMYKDKSSVTPNDYELVGALTVNSVSYSLEWTVEITSGDPEGVKVVKDTEKKMVTIDVADEPEADIVYKLTATITDAEGKSVTLTFDRTVPKFKVATHAEYVSAADDSVVSIEGVVTAIVAKSKGNKYNQLYLQDANGAGGYYVYSMATDPVTDDKLELGMTVRVTGTKINYSGQHEIKDAAVKIISSEKTAITPVDITDIYAAAADLKDATLLAKQALLVTIKGVEITGQELGNSKDYYKFKLNDLESYLRVYTSDCPLTAEEQATVTAGHTEHNSWIANVTGILTMYSGSVYLIPVSTDAFEYISLPVLSDEEMVAKEKENLSLITSAPENITIDLPATGAAYTQVAITWTSDNECAKIEDGKLVITLPETKTTVKITATLTCNGKTDTKEFEIKVDAVATDLYMPEWVSAPETGKAFKYGLYQATLGKYLYFTGEMDGYYLATSDKSDNAVDVYLEAVEGVEGGYRLYFMNGETKTYIELYERDAENQKAGVQLVTTAPTNYYTYHADAKTLVLTVGEHAYYLGTYSTYNTISGSKLSFITGENAVKVDVSQFPARLATLVPADYQNVTPETLETGKAFKYGLYQAALGKYFYFTGEMNGYYLATSDKLDNAVDVYLEAVEGVEGGYRLYFMNGETKTYIELYERDAENQKAGVQLVTTAPTNYYTYHADAKTLVLTVGEHAYYLGTYSTYNTISGSKLSFITGENAVKVDVSQFPARLSTPVLTKLATTPVETLETDKAFKYGLYQAALGKQFYFTGEMNGYYLATSDRISKAVDVYLEAVEGVEGGYRLYFMNGETKTYIELYERDAENQKAGVQLVTTAPTNYYTYFADAKTLILTVGENAYYLGTYSTYNTISGSKLSFITGENAAKVDVSQFPARLVTIGFAAE